MAVHQLDFYRARADEARADAAAATLAHVRERCERSLAAWTALADRAEQAARMRTAEEHRKQAATVAAAAAAADSADFHAEDEANDNLAPVAG